MSEQQENPEPTGRPKTLGDDLFELEQLGLSDAVQLVRQRMRDSQTEFFQKFLSQ